LGSLGPLAAFVNPSLSKDTSFFNSIVNACDQLNLPAPLKAVAGLIRQKTQGKSIQDLGYDDIKDMGISVLKNAPPSLIDQAMKTGAMSDSDLKEIGRSATSSLENTGNGGEGGGLFSSTFFQGIVSFISGTRKRLHKECFTSN
jgi:hypothetical protein